MRSMRGACPRSTIFDDAFVSFLSPSKQGLAKCCGVFSGAFPSREEIANIDLGQDNLISSVAHSTVAYPQQWKKKMPLPSGTSKFETDMQDNSSQLVSPCVRRILKLRDVMHV